MRNRGYFEASASVLQVKKGKLGSGGLLGARLEKKESWQGIVRER